MGFTKNTCEEFVDVLASKAPVPGGGGASALVGAIGMALGNMVGSLTVGKKKYADVEADIIALKEKATALQEGIRHAQRDRGAEGRESKSDGDRSERCLRRSHGDHGKML